MLTPEQIQANWTKFLNTIDTYISGERGEQLKAFYLKHEERFIMMPASHRPQYHNCFPGGYIDHVNRVVDAALKIDQVWREFGMVDTYTTEELVFSAINHDLGKFGDEQNAAYIEQTDQWRRDKLNETYMFNDRLEYMTVPDRGLHLLISNGILPTKNETLAIKLHDGLYDEANKPYLITFNPETKPRTSLIYVVHQADLLAARVEFEMEWLPKLLGPKQEQPKESKKDNFKLNKNNSAVKQKALKTMANPALAELMKNI
jgi:hypothetical protein